MSSRYMQTSIYFCFSYLLRFMRTSTSFPHKANDEMANVKRAHDDNRLTRLTYELDVCSVHRCQLCRAEMKLKRKH